MSISSPIPVLQGDRGTELRSSGEELVLRRRDAELRIPFAAVARVRAERREVAIELTAPTGTEPTVHRIEDVSAAAAAVFAEAVNAALPERAPGEEAVDGAALVVTRSLRPDAEEGEDGGDGTDVEGGLARHGTWPMYAAYAVAGALGVVVGLLGGDWSRGIATLLLGATAAWVTYCGLRWLAMAWKEWHLPRYGITVEGQQVFRDGDTTNAFTATDGVTRHIRGDNKGRPVQIAYHPRDPMKAVVLKGTNDLVLVVVVTLVVLGVGGLLLYGTFLLALPAFGG
ncbi:hypothetical protein ABZV60_34495 [Streptomyces sp. NPDC004787]|uniref:hypothetical protein n=1 Tax=Streptomyces sp. NPDC004787 TaxID=3154291 RepID=UPI0033BD83F0